MRMSQLAPKSHGCSYIPAAIVSPPRRTSILPISLFTENGSTGIGCTLVEGPEYAGLVNMI